MNKQEKIDLACALRDNWEDVARKLCVHPGQVRRMDGDNATALVNILARLEIPLADVVAHISTPITASGGIPKAQPAPHHPYFCGQTDADRVLLSLSKGKEWQHYPMVEFVKTLFGDDFTALIKTNRLFCEALSFAYRDVGSDVQRNIVENKTRVDAPEHRRLYTALCTCGDITIQHFLGDYSEVSDLVPAVKTSAFFRIREMMTATDRLYYGSNSDAVLTWVNGDTSRRIPFMEFIRKARKQTKKSFFPTCLPTLSELLLQFVPDDDDTMAMAGVVSTSPPSKKVATMTATEVRALVAEHPNPMVSAWSARLFGEEITGTDLVSLTIDNLKEIDGSAPMGHRLALGRWIKDIQ